MTHQDLHSMRQDIRQRFSDIVFPEPTVEPVFYGKREKVLCPKNRAVVDYNTGNVLSICSDKYVLVHHEDILNEVLHETTKLTTALGDPQILVRMMNGGARMTYTIHWPAAAKDVKLGDPVAPLFRGFNSYDTSWKMGSEYGAMRLVCTNGMVLGEAESTVSRRHVTGASPDWVRDHIAVGVNNFQTTEMYLERMARHFIEAQQYDEFWANLPFSVKEREKIEALPLIGFDGATLSQHIQPDQEGTLSGQVSAWMLQAALTQYNTHEMKSSNRSVEIAPRIGQAMLELTDSLEQAA